MAKVATPAERVDVPSVAAPSRNVTVPVGTPPGDVTVAVKVTNWPSMDGFRLDAIAVVVPAGFTVRPVESPLKRCMAVAEKFAAMVTVPAAVGVTVTWQAEALAVVGARTQLVAESPEPVRATVPVGLDGVPLPCVSVTVTVTDVVWPTTTGFAPKAIAVAVVRPATVRLNVWLAVCGVPGVESVTFAVNEKLPEADGVPEITPPGDSVSPAGSALPGSQRSRSAAPCLRRPEASCCRESRPGRPDSVVPPGVWMKRSAAKSGTEPLVFVPWAVITGVRPRISSAISSGVRAARSVTNAVSPGARAIVLLETLPSGMFGFAAEARSAETRASPTFETTTLCGSFRSVQETLAGVVEFFVTMTCTGVLDGLLP